MAQSANRLATGWTVRGSNAGGGEIFRIRPDRTWSPTSLLYNGYLVSFPGVKRPGCGVGHPPHLAPRLKKEQSYTCTPPLGLRGMFQGELYLYLYLHGSMQQREMRQWLVMLQMGNNVAKMKILTLLQIQVSVVSTSQKLLFDLQTRVTEYHLHCQVCVHMLH